MIPLYVAGTPAATIRSFLLRARVPRVSTVGVLSGLFMTCLSPFDDFCVGCLDSCGSGDGLPVFSWGWRMAARAWNVSLVGLVAASIVAACGVVYSGGLSSAEAEERSAASSHEMVERFSQDIIEHMTKDMSARLTADAASPSVKMSLALDKPAEYLYPTSVVRKNTSTKRVTNDTTRACADWVVTYNTGPHSDVYLCMDLRHDGHHVVDASLTVPSRP